MSEPTAHQSLTRAGLSAQFADLVLARHAHEVAEQAEAEQCLARVRSACDRLERAVINADGRLLTAYDRGVDTAIRRIRNALNPPAPAATEATVVCGYCGHPADWHDPHEGCVGPNGIGGLGSGDCTCSRSPEAVHDGGPTVQEATNDDRAHWANKHAGEDS